VRRGVIDLMVLRTLAAMGPQHGFGLAQRLLQAPEGLHERNQAAVYPALLRLEQRRWITSRWGLADQTQTAKFYELTSRGRRRIHLGHAFAGGPERVVAPPRSAMVMLATTLLSLPSADHTHVRASAPRILALIEAGIRRSDTFRRLVDRLDASDVIVYIEPKQTRDALDGYLSHNIAVGGTFRYLHIRIGTHGAENRLIAVLAHELQHAVEVVQAPEARDAKGLESMFRHLAIPFGCDGATCYETQASKDVEDAVRDELKGARRPSRPLTITASAAPNQ